MIDLAAQLFLAGMIDIRGKFRAGRLRQTGLRKLTDLMHLMVVPADQSATGSDLTISQADLDSLIRSKAAMYTILETITASVGMTLKELKRFMWPEPSVPSSIRVRPSPSACCRICPWKATNPGQQFPGRRHPGPHLGDGLEEIDRIRDRITYLELNVNQEFMNRFSAAKFLPHTNPSLFPSVKV